MGYKTRYSWASANFAAIFPGIPAHTSNPVAHGSATGMNAANDTIYCRVLAGYTRAATGIRLHLTASSGNIAVAVYADNGSGLPGTRLATSGSVASPGTGPQTVTFSPSVDVMPGMWIAISADNTTVTFSRAGFPNGATSVMGTRFQAIQTSAFPPPATASAAAAWRAEYLLVAV